MTSIIKLLSFSGADEEGPHCYLLQVDEFRFLLDCGWDEDFRQSTVEGLKKHVHQIDAVLLSYPDQLHLGALPYLVGKLGLSCPIYATVPVYKMGQMFMYDLYQSRQNCEEFSIYTLDDVDSSFERITQLKYSQTINLSGKGQGLQITALPAGHMLGGTIWKIVKDGEEMIVYAVDYNNKKDRHLNACRFEGISRPHLLITDVYSVDHTQTRRVLRDEQLMNTILETVRNDGNVLISIDTAGRVLELSQLLDQMWRNQETGLMAYSLVLMNNVSYNVVEFAKSQVEWMSDRIVKAFEDQRNNPFQFKYIQLCHSMEELQKVPEPKVVLASTPDMQHGFSRELFMLWCSNAKNCIILTSRSSQGTLCRQLMNHPDMSTITLEVRKRVKLEGKELEEHLRVEREKEAEIQRAKNKQGRKDGDDMLSSESEDEVDADESSHVIRTKHDLMLLRNESKTKTGFFKQAKKSYPMFPVKEERIRADEYGEIVRPEDFAINDPIPGDEEILAMETSDDKKEKEVPTKCIKSYQKFSVRARILYIDFEGRSDGESVRKNISQLKPRQLVLVRGSAATKQRLEEYCRSGAVQGRVIIPKLGETVDATTDSHLYQVKLKDSIVSALKFYKARDTEIAWVDAMLEIKKSAVGFKSEPDEDNKENKMAVDDDNVKNEDDEMKEDDDDDIYVVPTLVPLPPNEIPSHASVFINEPRLSEFRQFVSGRGIHTEMIGGALICNNVVAVRRNEAGKLQLEGCVCEDYYKIREYLYEQFAIV